MTLAGTLAVTMLAGCTSAAKAPESAGSATSTTSSASSAASSTTSSAASSASSTTSSAAAGSGDYAEANGDWVVKFTDGSEHAAAPVWTDYDNLIDEIRKDTDLKDRTAKMHQAEDMLMSTGAILPIYYYNDLYLEKDGFSGDFATIFGTKYFMYAKKDGSNVDKMRINLASEPDHLDPQLNSSVDGACLAANSFVGLYTPDKDDPSKAVAALADGDPEVSEDGTEYTIKMKTGLKWSDGTELNANDIVNSWKRAADPATASDYSYLFSVFKGYSEDGSTEISVDAPDDNTVHFVLNAPCPYMMNLLEFPVFMPVPKAALDSKEDPGKWASEAGFVTDGAYTLKTWKHNESMVYVKNPNYYDADNVSCDELDFMLSADDTAIYAAYNNGDLDYADTVPNDEIANIKNNSDFHVIDNLGTYYTCFNVNSSMFDGKTADQAAEMRRALGLLIDRQYIIDSIAQTEQKVATSFIPAGMSDGNGGVFKSAGDYTYPDTASFGYYPAAYDENASVEEAVAMLKDAGFQFDDNNQLSADTPITINYLTNEGTGHEQIAQAIQQDFAKIGVTMNINVEDWQTFLNDRKSGNFDVARGGWLADYDDPINMLEMWTSNSGNNDCQFGK